MALFDEPPITGTIEIRSDHFPPEILQKLFSGRHAVMSMNVPALYIHSGQMDSTHEKTTFTLEFSANEIEIKEHK